MTEEQKQFAEAREIIRLIVIVSNLKTGKEPMLPTGLFIRAENFLSWVGSTSNKEIEK